MGPRLGMEAFQEPGLDLGEGLLFGPGVPGSLPIRADVSTLGPWYFAQDILVPNGEGVGLGRLKRCSSCRPLDGLDG
jgi:hypothetical protein